MTNKLSYYETAMRKEVAAAIQAGDPAKAKLHTEIAFKYATLLQALKL